MLSSSLGLNIWINVGAKSTTSYNRARILSIAFLTRSNRTIVRASNFFDVAQFEISSNFSFTKSPSLCGLSLGRLLEVFFGSSFCASFKSSHDLFACNGSMKPFDSQILKSKFNKYGNSSSTIILNAKMCLHMGP